MKNSHETCIHEKCLVLISCQVKLEQQDASNMADSDLRFKSMWGVYQTAGNHSNGASASCYVIIHSPLVVKLGVKLNADYC